jgi:hypothetical protein
VVRVSTPGALAKANTVTMDTSVELYGERGRPTRAAIGCQGLALNHSVEVVMTVLFRGSEVRPPLARDRWVK